MWPEMPSTFSPLTYTAPAVGFSSPARMDSSVDLPQPLGPTMLDELALVHGKRYVLKGGDFSVLRLILLLYVLHPKNFQTHHLTPCNFL